jgi:hypothetical protein
LAPYQLTRRTLDSFMTVFLRWLNCTFGPLSFRKLQFWPPIFQNSIFGPLSLPIFAKGQFWSSQRWCGNNNSKFHHLSIELFSQSIHPISYPRFIYKFHLLGSSLNFSFSGSLFSQFHSLKFKLIILISCLSSILYFSQIVLCCCCCFVLLSNHASISMSCYCYVLFYLFYINVLLLLYFVDLLHVSFNSSQLSMKHMV